MKDKSFTQARATMEGFQWVVRLAVSENEAFHNKGGFFSIVSIKDTTYEKTEKCKTTKAAYRKTEKGKAAQKRGRAKFMKTEKGKAGSLIYGRTEKGKAGYARYRKTEKGKIRTRKVEARRRDLGFHPISLPLDVPFDWHHVNKNDVVAIPREIHKAVFHICGDGKLEGIIG